MKTAKDITKQNTPLVAIDKNLDKLRGKTMFPEKSSFNSKPSG